MKFAMLAALALAFTGVTLSAATDDATAHCLPDCAVPELPVDCKWVEYEVITVYDPLTGEPITVTGTSLVCYG